MVKHWHHHYHSPWRRGLFALTLVVTVMLIGTFGMHALERMSHLDAFYFMSMIATAQGPVVVPQTAAGKLFAAFMAFISAGTVVAALGFLFGPFFTRLWTISVRKLEEEERLVERKFKRQG